MPQTSKSACGGGVPEQGEPPQDVRTQAAAGGGDGGGATEDHEDPEIIKSPSDPKKYRWETDRGDLNLCEMFSRKFKDKPLSFVRSV